MRREPGFWPFMVRFNSQFLNNDATLVTLVEQIKAEMEKKHARLQTVFRSIILLS
jgi:hypothetical protein